MTQGAIGFSKELVNIEKEQTDDTLRILFIGNSYTYLHDIPELTRFFIKLGTKGLPIVVQSHARSGATLEKHWLDQDARNLVRSARWAYVIVQEQSLRPLDNPDNTFLHVGRFDSLVRVIGGKTVLFETWAKGNDPLLQLRYDSTFREVSRSIGCLRAPVGAVMRAALAQRPDIKFLENDLSHPNAVGSFLAASVFYSVILRTNPGDIVLRDVVISRIGLSSENIRFLANTTWQWLQDQGEKR